MAPLPPDKLAIVRANFKAARDAKRKKVARSYLEIARKELESYSTDGTRLYFIRCGAYIKIGIARDVEARLGHLAIGNPFPLKLLGHIPGSQLAETYLHDLLKAHHHRGEWLRATRMVVSVVANLIADPPAPAKLEPERKRQKGISLHPSDYARYRDWCLSRSIEPDPNTPPGYSSH